jgi:hypothetical protein
MIGKAALGRVTLLINVVISSLSSLVNYTVAFCCRFIFIKLLREEITTLINRVTLPRAALPIILENDNMCG